MDRDKFRIFKSGMTDDERDLIAKDEEVQAQFKKEQAKVNATMRSKGFKVILNKIVNDMEVARYKLLTCKEKDLKDLQNEVKMRKEFLDKWTQYQ